MMTPWPTDGIKPLPVALWYQADRSGSFDGTQRMQGEVFFATLIWWTDSDFHPVGKPDPSTIEVGRYFTPTSAAPLPVCSTLLAANSASRAKAGADVELT